MLRDPCGGAVDRFQQALQPSGTVAHKSMLDTLKTRRPIIVRDAFGHTVLANSRDEVGRMADSFNRLQAEIAHAAIIVAPVVSLTSYAYPLG